MAAQDPSVSTESNGAPLVNTAAAFLALTWASVLLRTYVRAIMLNFQTDDWFMVIAQVCPHTAFDNTTLTYLMIVSTDQFHDKLYIYIQRGPVWHRTT